MLIAFLIISYLVCCACQGGKQKVEDDLEKEFKEHHIVNEDNQGGPLLNYNFCKLVCFGQIHTLCPTSLNLPKISCNLRNRFDKRELRNLRERLIMGHNGLRNRIAQRLHVANMVELVWHDDLARMAERHILRCSPKVDDPCTQFRLNKTHQLFPGFIDLSYRAIAQNRFFMDNVRYPKRLIENALRSWYNERDKLDEPYVMFNNDFLSIISSINGENNFTHLSYPELYYFGCAFNRVYNGYLLVCNYYPYKRNAGDNIIYMKGPPGSVCPIRRPLRSKKEKFTNLCYGFHRNTATLTTIASFWWLSLIFIFLYSSISSVFIV